MQTAIIIIGVLLVCISFLDFFYTTLSGNGFGFISRELNRVLSKILLADKSKFSFAYSGPIHLLITTLFWLILIVIGSYILFLSGEGMVIKSSSKIPATAVERFYYTCYTLSSMGMGDFVPGKDLSRIFTGILSFSGLIFLTISLTYLLSVVTSSLARKKLALYISSMGNSLEELYDNLIVKRNLSILLDNSSSVEQMILRNSIGGHFFPITYHFLAWRRSRSIDVQMASLHELLLAVKEDFNTDSIQFMKIKALTKTIERYFEEGLKNHGRHDFEPNRLKSLRQFWKSRGYQYEEVSEKDKIIGATLKRAGWNWDLVYSKERD